MFSTHPSFSNMVNGTHPNIKDFVFWFFFGAHAKRIIWADRSPQQKSLMKLISETYVSCISQAFATNSGACGQFMGSAVMAAWP